MKKSVLIFVILISQLSISAQNNSIDDKLLAFKDSYQQESIGKYAESILTLMKIYDKYKDDYIINLRLGWLNYLNKDYDSSIKYYKNAIRIKSNRSIESFIGLTLPLSAKSDWDGVKDIYNKILELDENNYTANLRLGQIYLNKKDYLNAKVYLSKVHEFYPGDYESNLSLGWALYYLGDKSSARELFINVLTLSPGNQSALEGLKLVE